MKIILDKSKWICGAQGDLNSLGKGRRGVLWNDEGYGCILGHVCLSLGIAEEVINGWALPIGSDDELLKKANEIYTETGRVFAHLNDSNSINLSNEDGSFKERIDDPTPDQRIEAIREVLGRCGHTLDVIN